MSLSIYIQLCDALIRDTSSPGRRLPMEADSDTNKSEDWPSYPCPPAWPAAPSPLMHPPLKVIHFWIPPFLQGGRGEGEGEGWGVGVQADRLPHNLNSLRENSLGGVPHAQCIPYAPSEAERHPMPHIWPGPPMLADILRPSQQRPLSGRSLETDHWSVFFMLVCLWTKHRQRQWVYLWSCKMDLISFYG